MTDLFIVVLVSIICFFSLRLFMRNEKRIVFCVIAIVAVFLGLKEWGLPYYESMTFEASLKQSHPVVLLMAKKDPARFQDFIQSVKQDFLNHSDQSIIFYHSNEFINSYFMASIPFASEQSLFAFYQNELEIDKKLFLADPHLILYMEFLEQFKTKMDPGILTSIAGMRLIETSAHLKEEVIQSALQHPSPPLSVVERNKAAKWVSEISSRLIAKYGKETIVNFAHADETSVDQKKTAEAIIEFYSEILGKGEKDAGLIFRYLGFVGQGG